MICFKNRCADNCAVIIFLTFFLFLISSIFYSYLLYSYLSMIKGIDSTLFQLKLKCSATERRQLLVALAIYEKAGGSRQERLCRLVFGAGSAAVLATQTAAWAPAEKYRLFNRLLDLLAQQETANTEMELRRELNRLRVLHDKQLYDEVARRSARMAEVAAAHFCLPEELRFRELNTQVVMNHFRLQVDKVSLAKDRKVATAMLRILDLRELLLRMYRIEFLKGQPHAPEQQAAYRRLWVRELEPFAASSLPPHARITLYNARGLVLNRLGRYADSVAHYEKAIALFGRSETLRRTYFQNYLSGYNNLLSVLAKMGDARRFYRKLRAMGQLATDPEVRHDPELTRRISLRLLMQELDFLSLQGWNARASQLIAGREAELVELTSSSDATERHFLLLKFTSLCVAAANWKLALRWNNQLLDDASEAMRQDMRYAGFVLNLIIHLELGHVDLIASRVRAFKRRFARNREWAVFSRLIFPAFLKAAQQELPAARNRVLATLHNELLQTGVRNAVLLDDLLAWLAQRGVAQAVPA